MTKLSPDARDLIEAARAGESALAGSRAPARARVRARVLARVGAGVAVGTATALGASGTAAKTAITAGLLFKCVAVVGVAGVVAVVALGGGPARWGLGSRSAPETAASSGGQAVALPTPVTTAAPVAQPPAAPAPEPTVEPVTVPPTPPSRPTAAPRGPAPAKPSSLEAETALLERAQAELRAGHPDRALAAFDEHDAEFKGGVLREEQRAGRILALCAAGRTSEATAEAARFLADSPRSPMAERVRSSCAGQGAASP
jgi:hypothetical protein